jgi:methionyl-tRNA synthetase|tara:strand:+ start:22237 stop:24315 length:2079 start_codon:yes stop_codon:yes gene_type:complete
MAFTSTDPKRYTITAALPYTNGPVHIGHLAGVYIPADIYARFQRLQNRDVVFVCGSDEHGVPITISAKKEGVTPQEIVDKYHTIIKQSFADFGISFDNYSRTSAKIHHETASEFFTTLNERGDFIEQVSAQLYDPEAEQFLADRFVVGTCPKCGNEESYGDQCERCGTSHNATDLINPKSTLSGSAPVQKETKHWFLPLDRYESWLKTWILDSHRHDWKTNVYGQCKSWIDDGLRPRAVTRDLDWGIPVPAQGGEGKVLYVWFDAPIGYISATKEWGERTGKDWTPYWKDSETKLVHFIGKDNIVFHCIIFPSMLKAEGQYILPDNVPANEFLNLEGNKISTSKNWAVWLHEYLEEFPGQQDVLRYVLTANAPETKDNDFTWADFQARNNNELVAVFGNFVNRVSVLTQKYYDGVVPKAGLLTQTDQNTINELRAYPAVIASSIEKYRFREAQTEFMNVARLGNKYLADAEPWKLVKTDPERTQTVLFVALQITAALAVLAEPFLPHTSAKLKDTLSFDALATKPTWPEMTHEVYWLPEGHQITQTPLLFSRIEDEQMAFQRNKLEATKNKNALMTTSVTPQKETIAFEDFAKMDLRVGTITAAHKMPKANKLLVLKVDTGLDVRTIVSGIAEHYAPEEIIGQRVSVLINLAERNLRGETSQGMILMAQNNDGRLIFVQPNDTDCPNGAVIS